MSLNLLILTISFQVRKGKFLEKLLINRPIILETMEAVFLLKWCVTIVMIKATLVLYVTLGM